MSGATVDSGLVESRGRRALAPLLKYGTPLLVLIASLIIVAPLVGLAGADGIEAYSTLWEASFNMPGGFGTLLLYSVPLILVGLGVAVPLRAGLFNVGGEGQLLVGALAAVFVAIRLDAVAGVPGSFVLPLAAGAFGGAVMGGIAGALKAWRGINEIITTIMLNFIGFLFVQYWVTGPFKEEGLTFAATERIPDGFAISQVGATGRIPLSILVALVVSVAVAWLIHYTRAGWRLRLVADGPRLAEHRQIAVSKIQFLALAAGGALCGIGGAAEAIGNQQRVSEGFSPGWGFMGIAVAVLARGNMLAVVPYALFFGFLRNGSDQIQIVQQVPSGLVTMLVGLPVVIVAAVVGYRSYRELTQAGI